MTDEAQGSVDTGNPDTGVTPDAGGKWYEAFTDASLKGVVEAKQFQTPEDLARSYVNLEKLVGQDKIVMPKGEEDREGWDKVFNRLGRPENPDGYKFEGLPEGADEGLIKGYAEKAHAMGLTAKQASELVQWWTGQVGTATEAQTQAQQEALAQQQSELKREWGQAHDAKLEAARAAVRKFGFAAEDIDAMEQSLGYAKVMKMFASVGDAVKESSFVDGRGSGGFMTPDSARSQIEALKKDPEFTKKYLAGDVDARAKMSRLHEALG
jgi:hypothetical protein